MVEEEKMCARVCVCVCLCAEGRHFCMWQSHDGPLIFRTGILCVNPNKRENLENRDFGLFAINLRSLRSTYSLAHSFSPLTQMSCACVCMFRDIRYIMYMYDSEVIVTFQLAITIATKS